MVSPINQNGNSLVASVNAARNSLTPEQLAESYVSEFFALAQIAQEQLVPYLTPESYTTNPGLAYFEALGSLSNILQSNSALQLANTPDFLKEMKDVIIKFNNNVRLALQQLSNTGVVDYSSPPLGVGPNNLGGSSGQVIDAMNDVIDLF